MVSHSRNYETENGTVANLEHLHNGRDYQLFLLCHARQEFVLGLKTMRCEYRTTSVRHAELATSLLLVLVLANVLPFHRPSSTT